MSTPAAGLRYTIRLMDGGMTLAVIMSSIPEQASPETLAAMLTSELGQKNVVFGLDQEEILRIMRERIVGEEVEVAHGTPPRPGRDAELEMLLLPPSFVAHSGEDGRVDFKSIENVNQVKAGDVISRKIPADPGEPGVNVFGKPIRPPAIREARHPAGRNTVISEDGLEMRAARDGFLRWNEGKVEVLQLY
ncbi:MAG TPA: flagellar assembly protein A, partial [Chloroflexota bacterium]